MNVIRYTKETFPDSAALAVELTALKALASRSNTPVTPEEIEQIAGASELCHLFLQVADSQVLGWCMVTVLPFEDRAHLGPIAVHKEPDRSGRGSQLLDTAIQFVENHCPTVRRLDLSNRPSHDLEAWYRSFGFVPRTEAAGDPTTVYRYQFAR